jgi:hypothetical protein
MVLEERKEYKELLNSNYENTNLNIYFVTKGDIVIDDKVLFELRMLNNKMYDYKHIYLLKYKKLNEIMIENAGHSMKELELFSKIESFEDLKRYFKDNESELNEKKKQENKKSEEEIRKKEQEEIKRNPEMKEKYEEKWDEEEKKKKEEKKRIEEEKMKPISIENTEYDIFNTIPYNITYMLDFYFSDKRTIEIKGKEYIISKYKVLYEKGFLHKKKDKFIQISYDERNHKPVYRPVLYTNINPSDVPAEKPDLLTSKKLDPYGFYFKKEDEKEDKIKKETKRNVLNTINIVIELTVLDKSKNPSRYDFIKLDCSEKRKKLEDNFNLLSLNLFGIDLQQNKKKDEHTRFFFNRNVKEPEKKIQYPPFGYPPYGYPPYGYPILPPPSQQSLKPDVPPPPPPKKGGRKTIKRKNVKVKKHGLKMKKIKRKTMKKNTLKNKH